jgi:ACS family tartrate transporter-like MFS transporter
MALHHRRRACRCSRLRAAIASFWSLPTVILTGTAAAAGLALINSIGNLGGFVGPTVVGTAE